jgi:hypothetical protein
MLLAAAALMAVETCKSAQEALLRAVEANPANSRWSLASAKNRHFFKSAYGMGAAMRMLPLLFLLGSCGPQPVGTENAPTPPSASNASVRKSLSSGTRLKARVFTGADGSMEPVAIGWLATRPLPLFWDSVRNEDCVRKLASDGKARCLPLYGFGLQGLTGYLMFEDASCTQPVALSKLAPGATGELDSLLTEYYGLVLAATSALAVSDSTTYGTHGLSYRIHTPVEHLGAIFEKDNTGCKPTPRDPALYYYSRGAEIPPTEFVEMTPGLL